MPNIPEPNLYPSEPEVLATCCCCGGEIYKGSECYQLFWQNDMYICSECYTNCHKVVAGEED